MKEDACPIYHGNGAQILAVTRYFALSMMRAETSRKASIRRKQKMASMDRAYLDKILVAGFNALGKQ